jgi:hypothetical protein
VSIPKQIHYCWFGNRENQSPIVRKCIASWRKTGYEIHEWNEQNFDSGGDPGFERNLREKRYAFASDFARLKILYERGGLYLDTDVEVKKPFLGEFLEHRALLSFMFDCTLSCGVIGCEAGDQDVADLLGICCASRSSSSPNNDYFTQYFLHKYREFRLNNRFQIIGDDIAVFPKEYFECPTFRRDRGYAMDHMEGSWRRRSGLLNSLIRPSLKRAVGDVIYANLSRRRALRVSRFYPVYLLHARCTDDEYSTR